MPFRFALAALIAAAPLPALAQGAGFAGGSAGLPASGVPSNPFASNYPSVPPTIVEPRTRRLVRRVPRTQAPLPPGRIPR
ncbi:hypothetical protein [uncultured Methylobacterium sp.]|uniref:hypothetical protein n=1 Tax=uncultured Methylobacterium sp. TaxID=157278 RepID=UPI0035C9AD0B